MITRRRLGSIGFGLLFCLWIFTAVVGLTLFLFDLHGVISPEGVKLSDDADPFGPPRSRTYYVVRVVRDIVLVVWPLPFVIGDRRRQIKADC